jgi:2-phosphosulfolactate phosphatase
VIDVAFTRAELRRADVIVVIDVLRATSTVAQALASGYGSVLCVDSVERARTLRGWGTLLGGEVACVMPPDFDVGNSPLDVLHPHGERLVLATTNGAPAIVAATRCAPTVLLAAVLNLAAVASVLEEPASAASRDVQLVCSGTGGIPALEDVYLAGRLCAQLPGPRTDAARIAEALAGEHASARAALGAGTHAGVLTRAGMAADLDACAQESVLEAVPIVAGTTAGVATVVDAEGTVGEVCAADRVPS